MNASTRRLVAALAVLLTAAAVGGAEELRFDSAGVELRYVDQGVGSAVLLLHGYTSSVDRQWMDTGVLDALVDAGHRVVAYDHRGHGRSDKPRDAAYGLELVDDAIRLLDHLGLERVHVVGYSMGAVVANKLRDVEPRRFRSLVLAGYGELGPFTFSEQLVAEVERNLASMGRADGNDAVALARVAAQWHEFYVDEARLPHNEVPTLTLIGEEDAFLADSRTLSERLGASELRLVPGDHRTAPFGAEFSAALVGFLAAYDR